MKKIMATTYRGYTNVSGEITLEQAIQEIRTGKCKKSIERLQLLMQDNDQESVDRVKRQLPLFTVTGNFGERRLPWSLIRYNPLVTIDIDYLKREEMAAIRKAIEGCPYTVACFLSPRQSGFKVLVHPGMPEGVSLCKQYMSVAEIEYDRLAEYHAKVYQLCRSHIEAVAGVQVDTSGKEVGRGFFMSYDPNAYLNKELLDSIEPFDVRIITPEKDVKPVTRGRKPQTLGDPSATKDMKLEPWVRYEFDRAVDSARKKGAFSKGNRDNFMYALGTCCARKKIEMEVAIALATERYGASGFDLTTPITNGYTYSNRGKEDKPRLIDQVIEFLSLNYRFRRNTVMERLEVARLDADGQPMVYEPIEEDHYNTIFCQSQLADIKASRVFIQSVINSDMTPSFNPFKEYFESLPEWDGIDYIEQYADAVQTTNQEFWRESFKRWLVGLVACSTIDEVVNQYALILFSSGQGLGKSTWVRKLLPPQLHEYQRVGLIDFKAKDHSLMLSTTMLVNLDEFDGVRNEDVAALKRMISTDSVTERKVYATQAKYYVRRASFIGSTNNEQCLQDIGGNRRFLISTVCDVDMDFQVNHAGLYAQALHLLKGGYQYWYSGDEIAELNLRNEAYRQKDPVEELLYVRFRPATDVDYTAKWMSAGHIAARMNMMSRVPINANTHSIIVRLLERDGFMSRKGNMNQTEYKVYEFCEDEILRNCRIS